MKANVISWLATIVLLQMAKGVNAQTTLSCGPTITYTVNTVSTSGGNCTRNITYSITNFGQYHSYQLQVSCDGTNFTPITSCISETSNTGTTSNFTCSCNQTITLKGNFGTSNGNCGGGSSCIFNPIVLPVSITSFTVSGVNGSACLKWVAASEKDIENYIAEFSQDGQNFVELSTIRAKNAAFATGYEYCNSSSLQNGFYRIKIISTDGGLSYTNVVKFWPAIENITVYPKPAHDFLKVRSAIAEDYSYKILEFSGREVLAGRVAHNSIGISSLLPGNYILLLIRNGTVVQKDKFLKY